MKILNDKIHSLTYDTPPLPDFSFYHDFFRPLPGIPGGNIRKAYYLAYKEINCDYIRLDDCEGIMKNGRDIISASFVIPYPPGFPVLVPGQVMTKEILNFLLALDVKEIHGYRPELGLRVFREVALMDKKPLTFENKKVKIETENKSNGKPYMKLKKEVLVN